MLADILFSGNRREPETGFDCRHLGERENTLKNPGCTNLMQRQSF